MSRAEYGHVLSVRSAQIASTGRAFVDAGADHDPMRIAAREIAERRCPLIVRRFLGQVTNGHAAGSPVYEYWSPNEMSHPPVSLATRA